ncbi:DUF4132 domain-containing protein [Dactylosporangium sp. CA-139114]|uniref:DUF4132 domain-containing protein n=1 Tax=Dactylosporangium sp. CA-139114 TaxID=3239931 RepID=UPI003D98BA56
MTVMAWLAGERQAWLARAAALDHGLEEPGWDRAATGANTLGSLTMPQVAWLIAKGPDASARALIGKESYLRLRQRIDVGRVAVARFELDALTFAAGLAGTSPDALGLLMLPLRGPEPAALVAGWLRHLGSARLWARLWLERHPEAAARALIPAAAGRPGKARQNAEDALRYLAAAGHEPLVVKIAGELGTAALAAVPALLAAGPAPLARAKPPAWARPELLPPVRSAAGTPLPPQEAARLVGALTRSRLAEPPEPAPGDPAPPGVAVPLVVEGSAAAQPMVAPADPELERLIAGCDRGSLAAFGRALLQAWLAAGMPASHAWAILAQAHVGDAATWAELAPLVRSWPAKSRYLRAIDGHAVLATVGTDESLRHALAIEHVMSGGPMNERAVAYLTQAAARRGLSRTQLADRLTVTHGLETAMTLDYGRRAFTVVADEHLTLLAVDTDGRRLAKPPKPGVKDTNPEAYERFQRLKKEVRATAAVQIARLERDMLEHRLRPARDLPAVLLAHPILGPLARRLLWAQYGPGRRLLRALRIAEDGSFADLDDRTATVDDHAELGIVHPAELGAALGDWAHLFADYEIMQPFPQLNRPVMTLTERQRAQTSLPGGLGPVPSSRISALADGSWHSNDHGARRHTQLSRGLPGELRLVVELDPGVPTSWGATVPDEQRIAEIWVDDAWSDHWQRARRIPLGAADPAALSELLVELYAAGR